MREGSVVVIGEGRDYKLLRKGEGLSGVIEVGEVIGWRIEPGELNTAVIPVTVGGSPGMWEWAIEGPEGVEIPGVRKFRTREELGAYWSGGAEPARPEVEDYQRELESQCQAYQAQVDELGRELAVERRGRQIAEEGLAKERAVRESHEETLDAVGNEVGGGRHNVLERVQELIKKEKEHIHHNKDKKEEGRIFRRGGKK